MTSTSYSVPSFISMFRSSGRRRKNSIPSNQLNIQRIVPSIFVLADETWPEGKKNNGSLGSRLDRVHLRISKSKFQVSRRLSCATDAFAINRLLISAEKGRSKVPRRILRNHSNRPAGRRALNAIMLRHRRHRDSFDH